MRRPYGAESHETGSTIADWHNEPRVCPFRTLADAILPALSAVYRSPPTWMMDVEAAFRVPEDLVERVPQTITTGGYPLPSDWRERGWCKGLHEVTQ